jgi:hypothetical protein
MHTWYRNCWNIIERQLKRAYTWSANRFTHLMQKSSLAGGGGGEEGGDQWSHQGKPWEEAVAPAGVTFSAYLAAFLMYCGCWAEADGILISHRRREVRNCGGAWHVLLAPRFLPSYLPEARRCEHRRRLRAARVWGLEARGCGSEMDIWE